MSHHDNGTDLRRSPLLCIGNILTILNNMITNQHLFLVVRGQLGDPAAHQRLGRTAHWGRPQKSQEVVVNSFSDIHTISNQ